MLQRIEKMLLKLDILLQWLTALIIGGMVFLVFIQVVFRYVLLKPLAWSEELAMFLFIWMTFIGGYIAARKGDHIGMELLQNISPLFIKRIMQFLSNLIAAIYFGVIMYYCLKLWPKFMAQLSPTLKIPIAFVYLGMIIGSLFMCIGYAVYAGAVFTPEVKDVTK